MNSGLSLFMYVYTRKNLSPENSEFETNLSLFILFLTPSLLIKQ
jgi:hypothetical protein